MDSSSSNQNPQNGQNTSNQQPVPPPGSSQGNEPPVNQPVVPVSPMPTSSPSSGVQPAAEGSKITLNDLYGPSGLAADEQPVSLPSVQSSTQPTSPTMPSVGQVSAESVKETVPSPQPVTSSENMPPVSQISPSQPQEVVSPVPTDLPLRKQPIITPPSQTPSPPSNPENPSQPPMEKEKRFNKLFLLRLLFGAIGVVVFMVIILFVIQFLSSFTRNTPSSGKVTLTFWGLWEDNATMQSIITQFESSHPDITIQYEKEDPKEYSQRLLTRVQGGNGPDIFTYHSSWLPMVQNVLLPLPTSVISKHDLETNYYPVVRNDLVQNGALYGIPMGIDTLSLFVNKAMFKSAKVDVPTTWDNFVTVARALTVKDANGKIKTAGAAMGTFDNITHAPDILSALFMQNGVDVTSMKPSSNAADALSFYTSFATGDSNVWDTTLDPSQLAFARGNLAMYFGYSWDIFLIKASNPDLDFSVYPIPHLPGRNTTAASYWVEGVSSKSTHQKEALLFMQFLAQKNTLATLYSEEAKTRLFGEPYPQVSLGETLKDNALVYPFVSQAKDAKSTFFAGETSDTTLNGQMNAYLGNAVRGTLGNTSPQTAIDTLTQGVEQIEKQYGSG